MRRTVILKVTYGTICLLSVFLPDCVNMSFPTTTEHRSSFYFDCSADAQLSFSYLDVSSHVDKDWLSQFW